MLMLGFFSMLVGSISLLLPYYTSNIAWCKVMGINSLQSLCDLV